MRNVIFRAAALAVALLAGACSNMSLAQKILVPATGFTVAADIAYGADPRQKLDIYTPRAGAPKGTVLYLYGGSWKSGTKALYRFLGQALTGRGYQVVVADYRLYPAVRYPAFVEDGARALGWVKANIAAYGGRPDRLFLMGHSAGGYNAAMLAIDGSWLAPYGIKPGDLKGAVLLAPPLSFDPRKTESVADVFADTADIETARPVKLAAAGARAAPHFLLMHGTADDTVAVWNSENFAKAVNDAGGRATLKTYAGTGHLGVVTCFAWALRWRQSCLEDATGFMDKRLLETPNVLDRSPA